MKGTYALRLNITTDYALLVMFYLAENKKTVSAADLSKNISISKGYVSQIAAKLRKGNLIAVSMGRVGGYYLAKDASQISIYDIVALFEGPTEILRYAKGNIKSYKSLRETCFELETYNNDFMKMMTLDIIIQKAQHDGHNIISTISSNSSFKP